ncbi:MAG TPA: large-conductance mechanosensitive channel protein MscL [Gemmatimonadales bacterium]|nr:large-conductance mechanosensitive channel protein MscL [Gemmatimonadales bacterium]
MLKEFKAFALRGNVVDMAVGIIIGAAFGAIVKSLVDDVLMPPLGALIGGVDFSSLTLTLREASAGTPAVVIRYGVFINTVISFLIVAFAVFLLIRVMNKMLKHEEAPAAAPTTKDCPFCLTKVPLKATRCAACTSELR